MRTLGVLLATLLLGCSGARTPPPQEPASAPPSSEPSTSQTQAEAPHQHSREALSPPVAAERTCGGAPMTVRFYDVGQALAALVQLPDGRNILVDAGEQAGRAGCGQPCREWSQRLLDGLQRDLNGSMIDMLWITHQHSDHAGNVAEIIDRFEVGLYVENGTDPGTRVIRDARAAVRKRGVPIVEIGPNKRDLPFESTTEVKVTPIVPERWPAKCDKHPNDCSIGLRVDYCESSALFVGDAEEDLEAAIDTGGPITLLQVGHHGSNTSSSVDFIERVQPRYAVLSSARIGEGTNRTYCHPRSATVETLTTVLGGPGTRTIQSFDGATSCRNGTAANWVEAAASDRLWATARDGTVTLETTGDGTFVRIEEAEAPVAGAQPPPAVPEPTTGQNAPATGQECCRVCKAGKPCGDTCIAATSSCSKPPGCACAAPQQ